MPSSGKITYWESIAAAASADSARQKQQSIQGSVSGQMSGEHVTKITEAEPRGFVLTMSTGRLMHLLVSDSQGKPSINVQFMRDNGSQTAGVFGSLRNVFSGLGWRKNVAAVRSGSSWQRGQRYVIVATSKGSFQTWDLNWNDANSLVNEIDAKSDIFKALLEGAEVFQDQDEHTFEVLDVTILPEKTSSKEVAKRTRSEDCKLMALTVFKGAKSSKYALVGLTLGSGSVTINVIHPITCYTAPLTTEDLLKPQILVPEPTHTAFVIFERSVVLVSLVEIAMNPSSQLQMEAHTLPDPFQDVINFNQSKPYKVVGCAPEPGDVRGPSSCVVLIYGFGMIRVSALPMQEGQSALDRATVTAKTKIEQAVFFGSLQQDLLDFTPRPEVQFEQEEIEAAALAVSQSIMDSSSAYMPSITPSMDQQLRRRSTALADLNQHLRRHYPPLDRLVKWRLLWNAEKMACAKAVWECYDKALSTQNKGSDDRTFLAVLVLAIHQNLKTEVHINNYETDVVRHWFINDIWRIEYLVPYAQEWVERLFVEGKEQEGEVNLATHARFISEANDIQLATLETAFSFREANAASYALEDEAMFEGVLLPQCYHDLPEIWTSAIEIPQRVKLLVDVSRELTHLGEDVEGAEGEPSPELILKLAEDNPPHVDVCCRTWIERLRWLASRPDADSKAESQKLLAQHFTVRKEQLVSLSEIGQGEAGMKLAEKYRDMGALAEILEQEIAAADSNAAAARLEQRIQRNFVEFGVPWADAFFIKTLDGGNITSVLDNNVTYKQHLTAFLRDHPAYAKIGWINEVASERNYVTAADQLARVEAQQTNLWSKKIAFSIGRLSIIAGIGKGKAPEKSAQDAIQRIDNDMSLLAIQEKLFRSVKPTIRDALDEQAELDLAMQKYGSYNVEGKPVLRSALELGMRQLLAGESMPLEYLIATLTLIDDEATYADEDGFIDIRFFAALKTLQTSNLENDDPGEKSLQEKFVWRRALIQDNWEDINRTELKDEAQVASQTDVTALHTTLLEGFRTGFFDKHTPPLPSSLLEAGTTVESLQESKRFARMPDNTLERLAQDLRLEADLLAEYMEKGRLDEWWKGVVSAAKAAARKEADYQGELQMRLKEAEREFDERMEAIDNEAAPKYGQVGEGGEDDDFMEI